MTGEDSSYRAAQLAMEKMVATELFRLAMETDEEKKARLEKIAATTQGWPWRQRKKEELD